MKTLKKEIINLDAISDLSHADIKKIKIAQNNYKNSGKAYSIDEAYEIGVSKLKF